MAVAATCRSIQGLLIVSVKVAGGVRYNAEKPAPAPNSRMVMPGFRYAFIQL
jgi:hypothetical protein